ncbi:lymphocyte antigen 86 [Mauremys reevesii]|uniref:lymphocyte antigen 86 n=1 Tax=Mauremys reevesii TaxID=260615 RepID=UPI00193F862E|nr:lymphocyte antigen 86 [Mauremys reevesii]
MTDSGKGIRIQVAESQRMAYQFIMETADQPTTFAYSMDQANKSNDFMLPHDELLNKDKTIKEHEEILHKGSDLPSKWTSLQITKSADSKSMEFLAKLAKDAHQRAGLRKMPASVSILDGDALGMNQDYVMEDPQKLGDPVQDFALSIDGCSNILTKTFNIRAAMVLRHNIKELSMNINLIINGKSILTYSQKLCEPNGRRFIFCGKKKGEHIYYEGPVTLGIHEIPQGEYTVSVMLYNEDHLTVACADFTIKNK